MLDMMKEYNRLVASWKSAEKNSKFAEIQSLCIQMNKMNKKINASGYEMSTYESSNGFQQIEYLVKNNLI